MIIQQSTPTSAVNDFAFKRTASAPLADKSAATTTISPAAQERLTFEQAIGMRIPDELVPFFEDRGLLPFEKAIEPSEHASSRYRVEGPYYTLEEVARMNGRPLITVQMTQAQINETKLREQQEAARDIVNFNYAKTHKHQPVGQVVAKGELVATVTSGNFVEYVHEAVDLSSPDLSPADKLAEISRAVNGKIINANFLPTSGAWSGEAPPKSMLPALTARSVHQIFDQEIKPAMEQKIAEWEAETGKTYPRGPQKPAA